MAQSLQTRDWIKWTGPWGDYGSTRKSLNICIFRVPEGMMKKNSKEIMGEHLPNLAKDIIPTHWS